MDPNPCPSAVLVLDGAGRLFSWDDGAAAIESLAPLLEVGTAEVTLEDALAVVEPPIPREIRPMGGSGAVWILGAQDAATADRDGFLHRAGHDLRQPLAALLLFVGALEHRVKDGAGRQILRAMDGALSQLKGLVDAHLELSRLDAGVVRPDLRPHPINAVLTRLALEYAPLAERRRVRLRVQPCSVLVRTDRDLLERMLRALLDRGLEAAEGGTMLLGCRRRGDRLRIEVAYGVAPTGPGRPTVDRAGQVALSLAQRLALLLGDGLERRPGRGGGAAFAVHLPRAEEAEAAQAEAGELTVMVIEDDPHVLHALELLLRQWGCAVLLAASAEEALALVSAGERPGLVLADFQLGGSSDGIVAIRLVSQALGAHVPGLILTGDTDPRRLREAKFSGHPLLHKPVAPAALHGAISALVGPGRLAEGSSSRG